MARRFTTKLYNAVTGKTDKVDILFLYYPGSMSNKYDPGEAEEIVLEDVVKHGTIKESVIKDYDEADAQVAISTYLNAPF